VHEGTWRDAVLYSVSANATHGKRRTNEDKRRAVLTLLNDPHWERWSDRQIAKHCDVDGKTVAALRPKPAPASEEIPQIEQPRTVSRGSSTYRMNTAGLKHAGKLGTRQAASTKANTLRPTPVQNRAAWRVAKTKPSDDLGTDGRPVPLNRFYLSLRSVYDMIEAMGKSPDEFVVYAAQNRTFFDDAVIDRVTFFLSDLRALRKADRESAAADIRAAGTSL
jgi:hypothetical protein